MPEEALATNAADLVQGVGYAMPTAAPGETAWTRARFPLWELTADGTIRHVPEVDEGLTLEQAEAALATPMWQLINRVEDGIREAFEPGRPQKQISAVTAARALLAREIGEAAVRQLEAGGAYPVPSKLPGWERVVYLVPKAGEVQVVREGQILHRICIVPRGSELPWADVALARIKAIQADETALWAAGTVHPAGLEAPRGAARVCDLCVEGLLDQRTIRLRCVIDVNEEASTLADRFLTVRDQHGMINAVAREIVAQLSEELRRRFAPPYPPVTAEALETARTANYGTIPGPAGSSVT